MHPAIIIQNPENAVNNYSGNILMSQANVYFAMGDHEQSERLARKALQWFETWGSMPIRKHKGVDTYAAKSVLANVLNIQGKFAEAEQLYRQMLKHAELYYGKDNYGYLLALGNLSVSLYEQRKHDEALELKQTHYDLVIEKYGKKNVHSINSGLNLANSLVSTGDWIAGERLTRAVLAEAEAFGGVESRFALMITYNLAELLNFQGKFVEAEELSKANYNLMQKALTDKHPFTQLSLSNLATALTGQERYAEAEVVHQQSVDGVAQILGIKHPFYFAPAWNQIKHYHQQNSKEPGLRLLQQLLTNQTELLGAAHPDTLRSQKLLDEWN